jgi:FkbM family methyltransferase
MEIIVRWGHAAIVGLIRRVPLPLGLLMFRAYNKALGMLRPSYRARTYFGVRMVCDPHDVIQRMILHFGVWEPDVSRVIERTLSPGDVFVDIGANIGYDTLLALSRVGPTGAVVAIEASPKIFALLKRNQFNESGNVRAVNAAVSDRVAKLDLYEISEGNIGATTTLASRGGRLIGSVDALPLEEILTPQEISRLRLLKIDVEGAEPPILRWLLNGLGFYPAAMDIIVEASPEDDPQAWRDVFDRLIGAGFAAYEIANAYEIEWYLGWRKPTPLRRVDAMPARLHDLLFTRRQTAP